MPSYEPVCTTCEHYLDDFRCRAFPGGIPPIFGREFEKSSHTSHFLGQSGDFLFVEKKEKA